MSDSFYEAIVTELEAVKAELDCSPVYQRFRKLSELRDLYAPSGRVDEENVLHARLKTRTRFDTNKERVLELAKEHISLSFDPVPTAELFEYLISEGVVINGQDPKNNLSAMLSNSNLFTANGRKGWTLVSTNEPLIARKADDDEEAVSENSGVSLKEVQEHFRNAPRRAPAPPDREPARSMSDVIDDDIPF